ncbi:MAG TPA: ATP-binding protein [Arenimonas sp.]|nr:ATP-binding protein [Arenimonas sp.]
MAAVPQAATARSGWRRWVLSLQSRQLLAASLGLVAFLGFTGYALDRAFVETAQSALRERLTNLVRGYVSGTEILRDRAIYVPEVPPDQRFTIPGSGLYASIRGDGVRWASGSSLGRDLPPVELLAPGDSRFVGPLPIIDAYGMSQRVYGFSLGTVWDSEQGDVELTFTVWEDADQIARQVEVYRRALWAYLGLAAGLLLIVQAFVLRWSLRPLRMVELELARVQRGDSQRLSGSHPRELAPLADSINAFVESERTHLERSRNTLSDLAHSLKTPLAVLRARLESGGDDVVLRQEVAAQVQRMDEIVSYQLARAARSGHALFSAPLAIEPRAEEIVASLEKVYARKGVLCEFDIDPGACFHGELGDLQELIGNLLENAFKWAVHRVLLTVRHEPAPTGRRPGVFIAVDDDGPGIPDERIGLLLQRGVRGDERVHGHGIGLAIVQDIVRAYRGELQVERSPELGGARFAVHFPPLV